MPLRHEDALNSHRVASPLVRLMEGTTNQKKPAKCVRKSKKKKPKPKKDRSPDAISSPRNKPVRLEDISSSWEHQHFLLVLMT
ncbi:hypothetical protein TNCV_78181 [Trichonephila clavipes]|nr:hypothetical protein TNCV_78181 [Trichonephila clavipes]